MSLQLHMLLVQYSEVVSRASRHTHYYVRRARSRMGHVVDHVVGCRSSLVPMAHGPGPHAERVPREGLGNEASAGPCSGGRAGPVFE